MAPEKKTENDIEPVSSVIHSFTAGTMEKIDEDRVNREFYGSSISDSYRLKSELVSRCMNEIGMGRFHWLLFIVCGFGGMVDNL